MSGAFGSWLQGRDHGMPRTSVLRIGLTLMTVGLAVTSLLAWADTTTWAGLAWTVAGIGMGLSTWSPSVLTLDLSDANNSGRNSSAAQMASTMSIATALAVSGTLLALNAAHPTPGSSGTIITASAALALAGLLTSTRVRPTS